MLVSDIPVNKEVGLPSGRYFRCGDVDDLKEKMEVLLEKKLSKEERQEIRKQIEKKYNPSTIFRTYPGGMDFVFHRAGGAGWDRIAEQTIEVYRKALGRRA